MTITFKCGHRMSLERDVKTAPQCEQCGERVVASVSGAKPTFKGACTGPLVTQC
jgi:transcription initiation factor IIE alpha subunit